VTEVRKTKVQKKREK